MQSSLALKIRELASRKKITIVSLEKEAGLKAGAVRNILVGYSKRPSAEMLLAVSRVLGCTIGYLLDEEPVDEAKKPILEDVHFENDELLEKIVTSFLSFYQKNNIPPRGRTFYESLVHVYTYLNENNHGDFDETFCLWTLGRNLKS